MFPHNINQNTKTQKTSLKKLPLGTKNAKKKQQQKKQKTKKRQKKKPPKNKKKKKRKKNERNAETRFY